MKSFEEFVKENIEQKPKHKKLLDFEEQEESDGKEFHRVVHLNQSNKEKQEKGD